tara:strand:- start:9 stop:434 length:426 start_codon:yes stop_codon:yes gene_type:complete
MNILTTPSAYVMNDPVLFLRHVKKQSQNILVISVVVLLVGLVIANKSENEYKSILFVIMGILWASSLGQWLLAGRSVEQQANQCLLALLKIQNSKDNQLNDYHHNLENVTQDLAKAQQKSNTLQNNFITSQAMGSGRVPLA